MGQISKRIEGVSWDLNHVASFGSEEAFTKEYADDTGTYDLLPSAEAKMAALKAVWAIACPAPTEVTEEPKKPKPERGSKKVVEQRDEPSTE